LLTRSQQRYFNILDFMACQDLRIKLNLKRKKSTHTEVIEDEDESDTSITSPKTEPKKQKMGDFAAMMIEMKKTNGMLNDQNTKSNKIKKMIEKQSNESKEQCDEIKESINNIKDEVVRVEVENKSLLSTNRTKKTKKTKKAKHTPTSHCSIKDCG
jgi:seryl-tRNA synthetase